MPRPTPEQIRFFQENDLLLPPGRDAARGLMLYISSGNALYGQVVKETSEDRIRILREAQRKWIGRHVIRESTDGDSGIIETKVFVYHLIARTRAQMRSTIMLMGGLKGMGFTVRNLNPFKAVIKLKGSSVGLEWLKDPE